MTKEKLSFNHCLLRAIYAVCAGLQMLPSQEKGPVVEQLTTIHGKICNRPLDDRSATGLTLLPLSVSVDGGEMVQKLARDIAVALRGSEHLASATMIVELENAERDLAAVLDEIRQRSFNRRF